MSRTIQFRGNSRYKVGHAYATPPLAGPFKTREVLDVYTGEPTGQFETIAGWEVGDTVTFDRSLAEQYGRTGADPNDDGEEWAQFFLNVANNGDKPGEEAFVFVGPGSKGGKTKNVKPSDESVSVTGGPPEVAVDAAGEK